MPPLPAVPGVLRVVPSGYQGDRNWALVLHYKFTGAGATNNTDAAAVAGDIEFAWASQLVGWMPTYGFLTKITVTDLTSSTAGYGQWTGSLVGTGSATVGDAASCVLFNKTILRRYRGSHPRMYFPNPGGSYYASEDTWTAALVTQILSAWKAFDAALLAITQGTISSLSPVSVSYYQGFTNYTRANGRQDNKPTLRPTPIVDPVVGYIVSPRIATQRRRVRKG